jgi:hypothetical protein
MMQSPMTHQPEPDRSREDAMTDTSTPEASPPEAAHAPLEMRRLYTVKQAARIMQLAERSVRDIPGWDLPRCYVGRGRGSLRFWGCDLFCYINGLPMIDHAAHVERLKEHLTRTGPAPVALLGGKKRVL